MPELMPSFWPWEPLWVLALVGATVASCSLLVWRLRGGEGTRRLQQMLLALSVLLLIAPFFLFENWPARLWRHEYSAETSPLADDPALRTHIFAQPPEKVFAAAVAVTQQAPFWRLTLQNPPVGIIKAEVSSLGLFTNDVLIKVAPTGDGGTQVDLRASARRVGSDFGENPRHIQIFYQRLERKLEDDG